MYLTRLKETNNSPSHITKATSTHPNMNVTFRSCTLFHYIYKTTKIQHLSNNLALISTKISPNHQKRQTVDNGRGRCIQ